MNTHIRSLLAARFLIFVLTGALAATAFAREPKKYTIEEFLTSTRYRGASFSVDNSKLLVSSDATGVTNGWAITIADGKAQQLTRSTTESIFALAYFPNDDRFLYSSDKGGNELDHIFVMSPDGTSTDLTPGEKLKARFYGWAHDGNSFFVASNERDPRYFDLYEYQTDGYDRKLLYKNEDGYDVGAISPNKRYLALYKSHTRDNSDIYLLDAESGTRRHLTPHEGNINHTPEDFSPDSKTLFITTDRESDFAYLAKIDLESDQTTPVKKYDWDVSYAYFSHQGTYLIVAINQDASTRFHVYASDTMEEQTLPALPNGEISSLRLSRDEQHMAIYVTSGRNPSDLFYQKLSDKVPPRQLTRSLNEKIDPADLVEGKVVRFKSFDGLEVPGILYTPHQATAESKVPAMVWVHGGPGGQSRLGYSALIQYLVNHGYVIYAINNRGSSGYGNAFQRLDDRKHGEGDLDDCVSSKKMLAATGVVDPDRIGIMGGSYGGYMTVAALTFRPKAFRLGVDIFGVTNWVRTLQNIPAWWESYRESLENEMGDFDDEEYLRSISPLFHADKIQRPLMVLQGANDPRVLKVESDEIVAAARKNGVPVEYLVFDDEGHGFLKKTNQIRGYRAIREFLDKHLGE